MDDAAASMKTAGLIGLGAMGAGIVATLRADGYQMHVCDARPEAAPAFAAQPAAGRRAPRGRGRSDSAVIKICPGSELPGQ